MCTAIRYCKGDHYFGRNLDLPKGFSEEVTITPRNFPFHFRNGLHLLHHHAMIGMATISGGYPLYYEATNEKGLSMAGLNFPGNAVYQPRTACKDNIAPFELIPWVLGQCANIREAKTLLGNTAVWMLPFNREYRLTPLHWFLADRESSIVAEPMQEGMKLYDDPVGVLTNNPPFPYHLHNLSNYNGLQSGNRENDFCGIPIRSYSNGMGAFGLPGNFSSAARFVKAAFVKCSSLSNGTEQSNVSQFFHILSSVAMPRGAVQLEDGEYEITLYSSCCNTDKGIYYYNTYDNSRISAVNMHHSNLDADSLTSYPLRKFPEIFVQN